MTKRDLWLQAMRNVADAHHALIVAEYNLLCEKAGLVEIPANGTTREDMKTWAKHWLLNDRNGSNPNGYPRTIMCIKEVRTQFGLSLRDAKDITDEAVAFLRANGSIV